MIPTKATLFGLDVRFRNVDKRIQEQKLGRNPRAVKEDANHKKFFNLNRHLVPIDQMDKLTGKQMKSITGSGKVNKSPYHEVIP